MHNKHLEDRVGVRLAMEGNNIVRIGTLPNFTPPVTIPLEIGMSFPIDIGLGYKADASPAVEKFIEAAKEVCQAGLSGSTE